MKSSSPVLLSWVAKKNDPFDALPPGEKAASSTAQPQPGPTLTLLFDDSSPFKGRVEDVVLLYRVPPPSYAASGDRPVFDATKREIAKREPRIRVQQRTWVSDDPTNHQTLFDFLRDQLPRIRQEFKGRELLIHISPGTPAMQTLWVLLAECGFIEQPFKVVKSYRKHERGNRAAVVEVSLGIESFYKVYRASRPGQQSSPETTAIWEPSRFRSSRLKALFDEARRYARLKVPVLILGERGTGKTTLASWLRSHSPFRREALDHRWPSAACGQFSGDTIKSELFGHKAGSFTGATSDKEGLLSVAHGDTLFLDEVGDISRDVQRLLIRALEERQYTPLGRDSEPPRTSDFRLITATNLPEEVLQEKLDADFLDRISPLVLRMPALREIPEELPWLWDSLYGKALERAELEQPPAAIPPSERERILHHLREHPLPGNLRDLLRLAYRLVAELGDPECHRAPAECVELALTSLTAPVSAPRSLERALAAAFARNEPLDTVLPAHEPLPLQHIGMAFQSYLAREIGRLAAARGIPESSLYTGITDRTLRNWKKASAPPDSVSARRKKNSARR
ncbi:MAG TPA: sigma 54-interacting transcriptional regulator [Archangium sp.]|nr:sigma 54-interacting transcriptional regulator [Archangium sp.]